DSLGGYPLRENAAAADGWTVHRRRRRVLRRRNGGRKEGPVPLSLDATHGRLGSMGAGIFAGRRAGVGNELDHGVHPSLTILPPSHVHGSAVATSASGYQRGPSGGCTFQVAAVATVAAAIPTMPSTTAWASGRLGASRAVR